MAWRVTCAMGALVLLAGCEANPKRADVAGRVLLEDTNLEQLVRIVRQTSDRIEGDLLRIRTEIQNRTDDDLFVDVQVVWKDTDGYEVYQTNWAPLFLPARFVTKHEISSLRADVADYEMRLQKPAKTIDSD